MDSAFPEFSTCFAAVCGVAALAAGRFARRRFSAVGGIAVLAATGWDMRGTVASGIFPAPLHLDRSDAAATEDRAASAYGKRDISAIVGHNGENILRTKGNEGIDQILSNRLQLPQAVSDDTLVSDDSIARA